MKYFSYLSPLIIALTLLTRLPVYALLTEKQKAQLWSEQAQSMSVLFYPLVGLILAAILLLIASLLSLFSPLLLSVCILILWVGLTGALHLDGFADSIDAAYAAHSIVGDETITKQQQQKKICQIFKDPHIGSMAVVGLILLLLLKFALLFTLLSQASHLFTGALIAALVFSRTMAVVLLETSDYVGSGLATAIKSGLPSEKIWLMLIAVIVVALYFLPLFSVFISLLVLTGFLMYWRRFWNDKIGGIVGDCIGAFIEIAEVLVLFVFCWWAL